MRIRFCKTVPQGRETNEVESELFLAGVMVGDSYPFISTFKTEVSSSKNCE